MKQLLTGNEAVARGAWEAGVHFASAYPGTPSTEILENLATYPEIIAEWAPNEKVAAEAAIGASLAGGRSMVSMKHVGLNVAADPIFTFVYTGVGGGMVLICADEPGHFSSQNEQDNRGYAKIAKMPMFEPADSQEAFDMVKAAFEMSEQYDIPVMIRMTTRVCHSKSIVECGERAEISLRKYTKNVQKNVMVPANVTGRRISLDERLAKLAGYAAETAFNRREDAPAKLGVITSGMCYHYAKEVFGDGAAYLKLGFTHPLPTEALRAFCEAYETVYIIEENDPYIEEAVRMLGFAPASMGKLPTHGEMTADVLRSCLLGEELPVREVAAGRVVPRPPALCAGCPHRGFFYEAGRRSNVVISGDIGCYTLAAGEPYNAMDWTICMGSSLSAGHGAQKIFDKKGEGTRVISVLGDSTFFHTGVNSLLEVAYNGGRTINVILDNRITGMTGHQQNPGSGYTVKGDPANMVDIEALVRACGIKHVKTINPNGLAKVREALDWAMELDEPCVIITRWPCVLKRITEAENQEFNKPFTRKFTVDGEKCIGCKVCLKGGCPALSMVMDGSRFKAEISRSQCVGCAVCAQLCPKKGIVPEKKEEN